MALRTEFQKMFCLAALTGTLVFSGCASSSAPYMLPDNEMEGSHAPGPAFAGSGMIFRKAMPDRRDFKPWEFYYKHCSINGNEEFYSRNSYSCSGPYY